MTVLKVYLKKGPSVTQYCDYKNFCNDKFRKDLLNKLIRSKIETSMLDIFVDTLLKVFNKNDPIKEHMKLLS